MNIVHMNIVDYVVYLTGGFSGNTILVTNTGTKFQDVSFC